ncbi:MAG: DUF2507 domain-containing protein [Alkalibacterium sp.]|nr:DUF2507 domain-containing protein [Alkalibacterium sp.]
MHSDDHESVYLDSIRLLRDSLLPNLLKEDENDILYWAGKELARSFTFSSPEDVLVQMTRVFLGELDQIRSARHSVQYEWTGKLLEHRLNSKESDPSFSLEAGFLAAGLEQATGIYTEAAYEIQHKASSVLFILQSDSRVTLNQ